MKEKVLDSHTQKLVQFSFSRILKKRYEVMDAPDYRSYQFHKWVMRFLNDYFPGLKNTDLDLLRIIDLFTIISQSKRDIYPRYFHEMSITHTSKLIGDYGERTLETFYILSDEVPPEFSCTREVISYLDRALAQVRFKRVPVASVRLTPDRNLGDIHSVAVLTIPLKKDIPQLHYPHHQLVSDILPTS